MQRRIPYGPVAPPLEYHSVFRSVGVSPPQTPYRSLFTSVAIANARHSSVTGHSAQIAFAGCDRRPALPG